MPLSLAKIARACKHTASSRRSSHRVKADRLPLRAVAAVVATAVHAPLVEINLLLSIPTRFFREIIELLKRKNSKYFWSSLI